MHTHDENPLTLMQEHGIKLTANRILILKTLLQAGRPLSMTEIETALESVDKSIISRTLSNFREHHLLHTVSAEDSVHCEVCGRTLCLEDIPIPPVLLPPGFSTENVEYMVHGVCPACAGKR